MTNQFKPVETKYKGHLFRSRLEARWAVFFDTLGVQYRYELDGYDLGELGWYLPDFYLPILDCWIEIKGVEPTEVEQQKAGMLAAKSRKWINVISGSPWSGEYQIDAFRHKQPPENYAKYLLDAIQEKNIAIFHQLTRGKTYYFGDYIALANQVGMSVSTTDEKPFSSHRRILCFCPTCRTLSFGYESTKVPNYEYVVCPDCGEWHQCNTGTFTHFSARPRCFQCEDNGFYGHLDNEPNVMDNQYLQKAFTAARQARF